jgi:hypothetical protein
MPTPNLPPPLPKKVHPQYAQMHTHTHAHRATYPAEAVLEGLPDYRRAFDAPTEEGGGGACVYYHCRCVSIVLGYMGSSCFTQHLT